MPHEGKSIISFLILLLFDDKLETLEKVQAKQKHNNWDIYTRLQYWWELGHRI